MNMNQMKCFLTVASHRSVSEAAKALSMTPSALGRQIHAIETELDMELFLRGGRQLKLTPAGAALKEGFSVLLSKYEVILSKARQAGNTVPT